MLISDVALEELHVVLPDPRFEIAPLAAFTHLLILTTTCNKQNLWRGLKVG
jgi:hypothetical protein